METTYRRTFSIVAISIAIVLAAVLAAAPGLNQSKAYADDTLQAGVSSSLLVNGGDEALEAADLNPAEELALQRTINIYVPGLKTCITGATVRLSPSTFIYDGYAKVPTITVKYGRKTLVRGKDYTVKFLDNLTSVGKKRVRIYGIGKYKGYTTKYYTIKSHSPNKSSMYRLYNPNSGEHFYTASMSERNNLTRLGWRYEGIGWTAPKSSKAPVYRLYNPNSGDHHYTLSAAERDSLSSIGWRYEGIGWYSDTNKRVPLYRQFNPNAQIGTHNYTTSKVENDRLVRIGWRAEGVAWYGTR